MGPVVSWLVYELPSTATVEEILHGVARRLCDAGLDLVRWTFRIRPLSPEVGVCLYVWRPANHAFEVTKEVLVDFQEHRYADGLVQTASFPHDALVDNVRQSPFYQVNELMVPEVRCRIEPGDTEVAYPILADLAAQGATDYLALPVRFPDTRLSATSLATRKPGGFTDADLATIREVLPAVVLALSSRVVGYTMRALLGAYLGADTGPRVLAGKFRRGDVEEIEAAIWFSDLRGFTPTSASLPSRDLVAWLNSYFELAGRSIAKHGGEILKLIGDAVLAVWPVGAGRSREATCKAALAAAIDANRAIDRFNDERTGAPLPPLRHGIGLHIGRAQFGNIGSTSRLDFTVIGPAVNLAARLESACASQNTRVIASAEFAALAGEGLAPLGEIELKGVSGPQPVFGLRAAP